MFAKLGYLYLATGVRLSGFLLLGYLFPGFPSFVSPSASMVSRFPRASLHWFLCLLVSQPGFGRQVVSVSPDVSLHLNGFICFPLWLVVSPFWVVLFSSPGVSLYVYSLIPFWLVAPAVRMSSLCFHLAAIIFPYICLPIHLSPNSCVFSHQSALQWWCLILSLFLTICFPLHLSPHSYVSPSGRVLFFFHRDFICDWPLSLFFSPIVSCFAPAQTPDSNKMKKGFL